MKKLVAAFALTLMTFPGAAPHDPAAERSVTFLQFCAFCHGEDGKGKTEEGKKTGARDFTNKKWQEAVSDERMQQSITKGRDRMPTFAAKLKPEEIAALVKEVRAIGGKK
jgi:mono/diheme cytochrome c family protein